MAREAAPVSRHHTKTGADTGREAASGGEHAIDDDDDDVDDDTDDDDDDEEEEERRPCLRAKGGRRLGVQR